MDCIRYSPSEKSTIYTAISQLYIRISREGSVISSLNSYLDLNFVVSHAASGNRYADNNGLGLVNLAPNALFSSYRLTTSSGKHLEDISHAQMVSLMYKLKTSAKYIDDLSNGFDRDRDRRQRGLINNKDQKGKYHERIMLKNIIGLVEHQEKATYGLEYKFTIRRNTDKTNLKKDNAISKAKIKIIAIEWYVPQYTPSISNQAVLSKKI